MSLKIRYLSTLFFIVLISISCGKEEPLEVEDTLEEKLPEKEEPQEWPDELDALVELFIEEGSKRGVSIDADNLSLLFVDKFSVNDVTSGVCGYGWWNFRNTGSRRVEILDTGACWHDRTDMEKENFMFHELGHALLSLSHSYGEFPNGTPNSIMCSFDGLNTCNNYDVYHQTKEMRDYYLDQLFDTRTGSPSWSRNTTNLGSMFSDSLTDSYPEWNDQVLDWNNEAKESDFAFSVNSDLSSNYQLEIKANDPEGEALGLFTTAIENANITDCSSIKVEFDYTYTEDLEGDIQVWIGIHRDDENEEFHTIKYHEQEFSILELAYSGKLNAEIYCVPEETNYVTVSLVFKPSSNGTVTFSNIEVSQYD